MMNDKKKVEGHPNIYKDTETGVIVNRGSTERARYRVAKHQATQTFEQGCEIDELKRDLNDLKSLRSEMNEIKGLLRDLLNKP